MTHNNRESYVGSAEAGSHTVLNRDLKCVVTLAENGRVGGSWCRELVLTVHITGKPDEPRPRVAQCVQRSTRREGRSPLSLQPRLFPAAEGLKPAFCMVQPEK